VVVVELTAIGGIVGPNTGSAKKGARGGIFRLGNALCARFGAVQGLGARFIKLGSGTILELGGALRAKDAFGVAAHEVNLYELNC
jgi:hypothetical protein